MARTSLTITLLLISLFASAERHLFIVNQDELPFQRDAELWSTFFTLRYDNLVEKRLSEYTRDEFNSIAGVYSSTLDSRDTLIVIVDAHGAGDVVMLKVNEQIEADINLLIKRVIKGNEIIDFLEKMDSKGVRCLVVLNTCDPHWIIPPTSAVLLKYATIFYLTDSYSIMDYNGGSYAANALLLSPFVNIQECCNYLIEVFRNKRLYGNSAVQDIKGMSIYPIKPFVIGPNFTF